MSQSQKRPHSTNYTYEETINLLNFVEQFKHIVENKRTDAVTSSEKISTFHVQLTIIFTKIWEHISILYNAAATLPRTGEQLRSKFQSLKNGTRKYVSYNRQQKLQTGGGSCEEKVNPIYDRVRHLLQFSTEGTHSQFDSDALFEQLTIFVRLRTWEHISRLYNAAATLPRTGEQLRSKFQSLKKGTRKYVSYNRQQKLQTGGGPCEEKVNPIYDRVRHLILFSTVGTHSQFDRMRFSNSQNYLVPRNLFSGATKITNMWWPIQFDSDALLEQSELPGSQEPLQVEESDHAQESLQMAGWSPGVQVAAHQVAAEGGVLYKAISQTVMRRRLRKSNSFLQIEGVFISEDIILLPHLLEVLIYVFKQSKSAGLEGENKENMFRIYLIK
ncbi:hypothetical protein L9F63_012797, partial [Diploptera punctata]